MLPGPLPVGDAQSAALLRPREVARENLGGGNTAFLQSCPLPQFLHQP